MRSSALTLRGLVCLASTELPIKLFFLTFFRVCGAILDDVDFGIGSDS